MTALDEIIRAYPHKKEFIKKYQGAKPEIADLLTELVEVARSEFPTAHFYLTDTPDVRINHDGKKCALFRFNKSRNPYVTVHLWGVRKPINGTSLEFGLERNEGSDSWVKLSYKNDIAQALSYLRLVVSNTTGSPITNDREHQVGDITHNNEALIDIEKDKAEDKIRSDPSIPETEKTSLIKSRRGQGIFRELLIERLGGSQCVVTGATILLVASHIKPWAESDNTERLDPHNGLLLSPNYDKAFDAGYISFDDSGKIILYDILTPGNAERLCISRDARIVVLTEQNKKYLKYHRDKFMGSISQTD